MNTPRIDRIRIWLQKLSLPLFLSLSCISSQANILSYKQEAEGVRFVLDKGAMFLRIVSDEIVEVRYTSLPGLATKRSLVVLDSVRFSPAFSVSETKDAIIIKTRKLELHVDRKTEAISYADAKGNEILREAPESNKVMRDTTVAGINTSSCATSFLSPADEALYGLGCHPLDSGSINYKGRNQSLAIKYLTGAIPVLLSTRGYGLMWDNYAESAFYGTEANNTRFTYLSESGNMIDYYFFYGPSFDKILDLYRRITGQAPMYPKWAFGLFQSQDRYKTQQEFLSAASGYKTNHIPVDVVVQDWYYWYPLPIGSHIMEPSAYPDPKAMVREIHREHLHGMISIWPCFGSGTANFDALKKAGDLTDITWDNFTTHTRDTYYDAHNPKARELYWDQARDSLIKKFGWDAWWVDQCEPDTEDPNTRKKSKFTVGKSASEVYPGRGIDYFNTYALVHTGGIYTKWRRDIPGKRIFLLARQAFAGSQRNAATLWSSDIHTTFSAFKAQVPQAINACVSGIPYWTSDIGGYLSPNSPNQVPDWSQPAYSDLFTRWFQFGAFCPIFRIHGKGERALFSKNWDEPTRETLLKFDNLRYRLLPYIYSLSAKVTRENYTILRSLAFDFREDRSVYDIPDQYMFGPAFLVNPVTAPGQETRSLYLPHATWYDFWTGEKQDGGRQITVPSPLSTLPLFVRAGSIIPMGKIMEYATEKAADTIELRIYPGDDGKFTLYEDENNNYKYEKGAYSTIDFLWSDKSGTLTVSGRKGSFPGMLNKRIFQVVLVKPGHGIGEKPSTQFDKTVTYTGKAATYSL
jgi:alpha-D-xyloside xylohydrolase